jgi:hypothetical protein
MKNKTIKKVLLAVTVLALACNSKKEGSAVVVDKEQIKKEIQAKEDEFAATYNSKLRMLLDDMTSFSKQVGINRQRRLGILKSI